MRVVVTGGAGFLGSHLCDALMDRGDEVICIDNLSTGQTSNIAHLLAQAGFEFQEADVCAQFVVDGPVDAVAHLASPASPLAYQRLPLETLTAGSQGTLNGLHLAEEKGARFILASTSEVYGDPTAHPQHEEYWGYVNPIGPRSVYDEAKRYAEALTSAFQRHRRVSTGIVRIFNTYGPRMRLSDGRVVTNFIRQALNNEPITIYGDGLQTRSLCYVDDLIQGIVRMLDCTQPGPVNLGNPEEFTISNLAQLVLELTGTSPRIEFHPLPVDDPTRRRPAIDRARELLGWEPKVPVEVGIRQTIAWHRAQSCSAVAGRQAWGAR